jgi:hypothetical protein
VDPAVRVARTGSGRVTKQNIDAKTLRDMLERGERVTVVDVRKREAHPEA